MENTLSRYVFSGGPGFGKSTVLEALSSGGCTVVPDVPRELIIDQRSRRDGILPGDDFIGFARLVCLRMSEYYRQVGDTTVLFDRGLPDLIAYCRHAGLETPRGIVEAVENHPYGRRMFYFPEWRDIYELDGVRYETFEQAAEIGRLIREVYKNLGYEVIEVPKLPPKDRLRFVRDLL